MADCDLDLAPTPTPTPTPTYHAAMEERTLSITHPWSGRRIRVRVDEVERADGHRTTREIVEHPGAVAILAWDGDRLAMVRQWRHAPGEVLLEIPAGTLEPDEGPMATARRELAEEVGLSAAHWEDGPTFFTAPGFCDERMHLYLATGLSESPGDADPDELLEPTWMTLPDALAAIDDGRIRDAKTFAGIGWLARRLPTSGMT
jgi:ADP-ribose pyrophosphatase